MNVKQILVFVTLLNLSINVKSKITLEYWSSLGLGRDLFGFSFNNKYYSQTSVTAMGKQFAPNYADIHMANFESEKNYRNVTDNLVFISDI